VFIFGFSRRFLFPYFLQYHLLDVTALPIYSTAFFTVQERRAGSVYLDRHEVFDFFSGNRQERFIANGTASEKSGRRGRGKHGEHLSKLLRCAVALDKQVVRGQGTSRERDIPRQDRAALIEREAEKVVVVQRPIIEDIETHKPHSLCQSAQHDIGDKFHGNSP
jgi:hypothetical protein